MPISVLDVAAAGGEVNYKLLWLEALPEEGWSAGSNANNWKEMWECSNERPWDLIESQGGGIGLPVIVLLEEDPRSDRFLMDYLTDTGSRAIKGMAAVNGEVPSGMKYRHHAKKAAAQVFMDAYEEMEEVMKVSREYTDMPYHQEKTERNWRTPTQSLQVA